MEHPATTSLTEPTVILDMCHMAAVLGARANIEQPRQGPGIRRWSSGVRVHVSPRPCQSPRSSRAIPQEPKADLRNNIVSLGGSLHGQA